MRNTVDACSLSGRSLGLLLVVVTGMVLPLLIAWCVRWLLAAWLGVFWPFWLVLCVLVSVYTLPVLVMLLWATRKGSAG